MERPLRGSRARRPRPVHRSALVGILTAALTLSTGVGCSRSSSGDVTVFAASSLTESFEELTRAFDDTHGGETALNLDGSARLATQIDQGAPADVFASADRRSIDPVVESGDARRGPEVFALNKLTIVVESGNPTGITGLADLASDDVLVALADPAVPAGAYAAEALDLAGVAVEPVTLESNVRGVVTKVMLGEADAGIVYDTDVASADGAVDGVAIPDEHNVTVEYLIAVLDGSPTSADDFTDLVLGPEGRAILVAHGFQLP